MSSPENISEAAKKPLYWSRVGLRAREGFRMHRVSGQLDKDPVTRERPWGNVTEHCLVQVARVETLGEWIGLPEDIIAGMRTSAGLHDAFKKQEITAMKEAEKTGDSPLAASNAQAVEDERVLQKAGFSQFVIRLAGAPGGKTAQLLEAQRILDKPELSSEDWAYLIVHYVDDCSVGSDCVRPSQTNATGEQTNIIDFRTEGNKAKSGYNKISQEIAEELQDTVFDNLHPFDAMALVSHQIEQRLARAIFEKTGETVDPLLIPELVDRKIQQAMLEHKPR